MMRISIAVLLSVAGFQGIAAGDQWPEFRGPAGNGHSATEGIPLTWSETENIAWKTPIHGRSFSSPVIWDDQVWMTTATEDGTELSAICVDAGTGAVLFDRKLFDVASPPAIAQFNSFSVANAGN